VDIVAVGNTFAPIPEVGRFDGGVGWLLRGDGSGSFEAKSPADSGIIVRRDAKALAVVDFNRDGWPDLFVTRNNDRALAFRNSAVKDRRSFGLTLRGRLGNPAAVGARITVSFSDGRHSMAEIAAGSGYFAQSTSTAFFGYTEASVPTAATIRWPDGSETTQTFSAPPLKIVRISAP
jgi:enediyne biosynthesis protein E4